jgi:uncharacterized membrane protein YphA (DoxX/SURF4 family)
MPRLEVEAIVIGVLGIAGVSLVVSGVVKWPISLVLLVILYIIIVGYGLVRGR